MHTDADPGHYIAMLLFSCSRRPFLPPTVTTAITAIEVTMLAFRQTARYAALPVIHVHEC